MVTDNTNQADDTTAFLRAARSGNLEKVVEYLDTDLDINTANSNGLNALHLASKDGHVEIVTELLKRGAHVDAATKKGNTALHIASLAGQAEIVTILLQYGSTVNIQSQNGFTPLYMAAQENHDQVVKILLCSGANQSLATEDGFTPLAVAMQQGHDKVVSVLLENDSKGKVRLPALHIAAKKDDCKAADLLLQNDHKPDVTSKSGFTPLHIAAHYGNEEIARLLIKRGADVNYLAKHNISPLHVAAKWGKNNMVKILLESSATIDSKTRDGLTPLHCAARSGHDQVVAVLLENSAPISARTKNGLAPLHMASQGDHVDAARVLLYHRAPVDEVTIDYLTSLHVAAHCGHVRVAKLLLDRKADPNARALNGFTPLHIACKKNRIKVVELLIKHGASIESTTESGLTPLHVASFMGCMNIVIFLLQHEASPDVPTVRGETPLHLAARANQTDIIRILLRNGAKVDARAREQQTPLHVASRLGNVDIVMLLLQHGAAVDTTTKDMYTALHIAAKEGQEEVAAILVENHASLRAATKNGFTPLHIAAKYGNINVAKILLQKDNALDAGGKNEITALHMACHYDHPGVAGLLLERGASPRVISQNGHTPLHVAARKNQMEIASALLEHGADANIESKAGFTPLHLSAQKGHHDMTNLLVEHGADPNHKAKNGLTALHLCAQEDFVRVASILVKNGANVESRTETGYRPIHVAAHFGNQSMVRFLLKQNAEVDVKTNQDYTPLHQAAQQGHAHVASALLDGNASHRARTNDGLTALNIAQKLGYISVMEVLKGLSYDNLAPCNKNWEEKYKVVAPESLQEASFMSDSDDEGGSDTLISEQPYRYLTADLMKSLRDDSLPIDVTRDDPIHRQVSKEDRQEFVQSNNYCSAENFEMHDSATLGFLVSFLVDARGGTMRGIRHSGIRIVIPPRRATMPLRITCRLVKAAKTTNPPPLMEGEALATRVVEMGPVGATFLGPVLIDIPHFASARGKEREIIILRSENGETWKEHDNTLDNDDTLASTPYDPQMSAAYSGRVTRVITTDFPQYFAIITRIKQEVHVIGSEGGILISSVVNHVQAVFPPGALTKKIKVGLQAHVIPHDLTAKLLGNCVAVSPVITIEPRRRKFHKPITLTIPVPQAANKGMINQYGGETPTLRLLCSIAGGTSEAQWEDVTGSTPLTFMNDRVSFTTTVSARFWLMDCRNIGEVPKMATELYKESLFVPFVTNFVIYSKRMDVLEATLRILCMTDGKEGLHTLERQEEFLEIVKSRDVEALDSKDLYIEFSGNLIPVTKSGVQLKFTFKAFRQNRLSFHAKVKDPLLDPVARMLFMREPKVAKGEPSQQPICILNIVLPELLRKDKFQTDLDNESDLEDSNIISHKIDSFKSEYEADGREKSDDPKAVVGSPLAERKFIAGTAHRTVRGDAASIHESFAQKTACSLESVEASYPNKIDACERDIDDGSPEVIEKQTYSEKRQFWEEITKKKDASNTDQYESEVSRSSLHSTADVCTDSQLTESSPASEHEGEVAAKSAIEEGSDTADDINIPDISECSVAEKAHYFEEQIQKELMAPAKTAPNLKIAVDSESTKSDRKRGREKDRVVSDIKLEERLYEKRADDVMLTEIDKVPSDAANKMSVANQANSEGGHGSQTELLLHGTSKVQLETMPEASERLAEINQPSSDNNLYEQQGADVSAAGEVFVEQLSPRDAGIISAVATSVIKVCEDMLQEERRQTSGHAPAVNKVDQVEPVGSDQISKRMATVTGMLRESSGGSEFGATNAKLEPVACSKPDGDYSILKRDNHDSELGPTPESTPSPNIRDTVNLTEDSGTERNAPALENATKPDEDISVVAVDPVDEIACHVRNEARLTIVEGMKPSVAEDDEHDQTDHFKMAGGKSELLRDDHESEKMVIAAGDNTLSNVQLDGLTSRREVEFCREFLKNEILSACAPVLTMEQTDKQKVDTTTKGFESRIPKHIGTTKVEKETRTTKPKLVTMSKIPVTTEAPSKPGIRDDGPRKATGNVAAQGQSKGKETESRIPKRVAETPKTGNEDSSKHPGKADTEVPAHVTQELKKNSSTAATVAGIRGDSSPPFGHTTLKYIPQSAQESCDFSESLRTEKKMSLSVSESKEETFKTSISATSKVFTDEGFEIGGPVEAGEARNFVGSIPEANKTELTIIKSTVDRRLSAKTEEKKTLSSEITTAAGKTVVSLAEKEHSKAMESKKTESSLVKESPTQRVEVTERNSNNLKIESESALSVKLLDDCGAFIAEGQARETVVDSAERGTFKLLQDEHGIIVNETSVASVGENIACANVEIRRGFQETEAGHRSEFTEATCPTEEVTLSKGNGGASMPGDKFDSTAVARPQDYEAEAPTETDTRIVKEDANELTKESEARAIAETIIQSIETEIESRSLDEEYAAIRDNTMLNSSAKDKDKSIRLQLSEASVDRTFDRAKTQQEIISVTEDLTKDEDWQPRSEHEEGSMPFETSIAGASHGRDITVSPSTMSDRTEMEESMEVDSTEFSEVRKPAMVSDRIKDIQQQSLKTIVDPEFQTTALSRKQSFDELAARDSAFPTSGARVLEIIEPETNVVGDTIKWETDNNFVHSQSVVSRDPSAIDEILPMANSNVRLYPERDITISPSTVSEQTDSIDDSALVELARNDYDMVLRRETSSIDADSPPLASPKIKIQSLDIKPVNWMIGDEKIEISEPLQPSQVFNQELEEYESVIKQLSIEEADKNDDTPYAQQAEESHIFRCEGIGVSSETVGSPIPKEMPRTKFTVIPVSDKQLESELVENNLDISCQELMDTLQKEFDAKTPTDNYVLKTSASELWNESEGQAELAVAYMQDSGKEQIESTELDKADDTNRGDHLEDKEFENQSTTSENRGVHVVAAKEDPTLSREKGTFVTEDVGETRTIDAKNVEDRSNVILKEGNDPTKSETSVSTGDTSAIDKVAKEDDAAPERQRRGDRGKSHHSSSASAKTKRETDAASLDLSTRYAITVLDQVVKKEIAEVKESLQAAKQDLIEELSENSETVFQIKDSPSEFQFKLQPESIPNELPFLYKAMSADEQVHHGADVREDFGATGSPVAKPRNNRDESTVENDENLGLEEARLELNEDGSAKAGEEVKYESGTYKVSEGSEGSAGLAECETVTVADSPRGTPTANSGNNSSDLGTAGRIPCPAPVPASRSSSDVETNKEDAFLMCPPQPAPRRRHKPARAPKKLKSDSETELGYSSGESNYQPCDYEIGSGSRPSSSDIEAMQSGLPSGTASEYETAMMSFENSSASRPTSQDYHTAISSLSSRESMKSLNSESSGHLASIESSSELSETLVPSEGDIDRDNLDENVDNVLEEDVIPVNAASVSYILHSQNTVVDIQLSPSEEPVATENAALPCRMKRSSEMIFQQTDESCGDIEAPGTAVEVTESCTRAELENSGQDLMITTSGDMQENKFMDNATSTALVEGNGCLAQCLHHQSVDLTTSRVEEDGVQSVCTQVTSRDQESLRDGEACQLAGSVANVVRVGSTADGYSDPVIGSKVQLDAELEVEVALKEPVFAIDAEYQPMEAGKRPDLTTIQQTSMSTSSTSGLSLETVIDNKEKQDRRSPDSDSFELVDKPDIIDDFVVIEEVGREAEEFDSEGKSIHISTSSIVCASAKKYDRELENLIANNVDRAQSSSLQSSRNNELFDFESEESPPQMSNEEQYSQSYSDEEQYEGGKKWVEMQFQTDARGYEIDYDRGPLEDIKEEEITDFEAGSSRFGSLGSHKESVGSTRGSLGSTPEYDVLAGRKYFTKPSEHDNLSLSSLQEFETLESAVALENAKKALCGSQDSINNGSLPRRYLASRSGHGDDVSLSSLKDFEGLETACRDAHMIELRAREEEDLLDHESPENRYKLESLARAKAEASAPASFNPSTSGSDDYERRIKEIDEIIRIAQSNVEKFDRQDDTADDVSQIEITETECRPLGGPGQGLMQAQGLGPGATVGITDTCSPAAPAQLRERNVMETSTDSLELDEQDMDKRCDPLCRSSDSLEMKTTLDIPSLSSDSLNNARDPPRESRPDALEQFDNTCRRISSDSLEMPFTEHHENNTVADKSYDESCGNRNYTGKSDTDNSSGTRISTNESSTHTNISLKNTSSNNGT